MQIDLRQLILALETTVDLVGMNDTNHAKRVGYIASRILQKLGQPDEDLRFVFELGLLHDCGVSTEQVRANIVNHFDWEDAHIHCEIGHQLLKDFEPLAAFAEPILYHHTHWSDLTDKRVDGRVAEMANVVFLADRVDVVAWRHRDDDILVARQGVLTEIERHRGTMFNPDLVDALAELERSEAFWISLEARHITRYTWDMGQFQQPRTIDADQLRHLALIMSYIVDQKSQFTAEHSTRVGVLARHLAERHGLDETRCVKVELAGYLHDLGKLRVPDHILEKPGPMTEEERAVMNHHSYETYEILRRIGGIEDIAQWAAFHHEGLDGTGYPFHPRSAELTVEARIVAVADVFQALVQDRPYREGMALREVMEILDDQAARHRLDPAIVALVHADAETCFNLARQRGTGLDIIRELQRSTG